MGKISSMKDLRVIILAAGKGTRMKSELPKVLHQVCGRPMLSYVLDSVRLLRSLKTYVILGHKINLFKDYLNKDIIAVHQKKLLGTADAVRCAEKYLKGFKGNLLVVCGDTPLLTRQTLSLLIKKRVSTKASCSFLSAVVDNPFGYGRVIRNNRKEVVAIKEEKDAGASEKRVDEINVGVYCFYAPDLFKALKSVVKSKVKKEYYLTDVIQILKDKDLKVSTLQLKDMSESLGINTREDLALSERLMRQRILSRFMQQGVTIEDPQTTFIAADAKIGKDTRIRPFTVIEEQVKIGKRCIVGPFCRIRTETAIKDDVEIGNFTEISRTQMGSNCFMKHFSFLGDSFVGNGVNIGAGAVTANFDGKTKHVTHIKDGAFIGSDSILVAPVEVGSKAITGAGSVVTRGKKIPAGAIAVGVPAKIKKR